MNTKIKIAAGMFAGLIAGTMLVGTAVAAPRMMTTPAFGGYGMMRSFDASGTFGTSVLAEMNAFMDQYRTANGSIDANRMHADVTSGKVTPPFRGMMGSLGTSGTFDAPTIAEMNAFMDQYRTANGSIDVNRMHADVVRGKVTPPHMNGTSGTGSASKSQGGRTSYRRGPAMMQGYAPSSSSTGYGMMGSTY
jgi:hypothetical protein